ncbi:MAG: hypothetical protein SV062_11165 [Thermodesulfobacteriota bacterium]|nr:hypothetical protein [Thermodesulfobacteriota bacterium]
MAGDRKGLSYYSFDKICILLGICVDEYIAARDMLIKKGLIAFDGRLFQVLSLPEKPIIPPVNLLKTREEMEEYDPAAIHQLIARRFGGKHGTREDTLSTGRNESQFSSD